MSNIVSSLLTLKEGVGERLRAARTARGLKQSDLASMGAIARATQISYETGVTEPTTAYLRAIQASGIDLPQVLFGLTGGELDTHAANGNAIDWHRLQQAAEDVEFFCQRFAPQCPAKYRWQLVRDLYSQSVELGESSRTGEHQTPMELLTDIWARYTHA